MSETISYQDAVDSALDAVHVVDSAYRAVLIALGLSEATVAEIQETVKAVISDLLEETND